jgi:hypothetical protein
MLELARKKARRNDFHGGEEVEKGIMKVLRQPLEPREAAEYWEVRVVRLLEEEKYDQAADMAQSLTEFAQKASLERRHLVRAKLMQAQACYHCKEMIACLALVEEVIELARERGCY